MENEHFFTRLLMTIFGIILWIIVIIAIIFAILGIMNNSKLENEGKIAVAKIWNIYYDREDKIYNYYIEYTIGGKKYNDQFKIKDNSLKEGDTITVYYLQGKEDKIYLSKESNTLKNIVAFIFYIIILVPIAYFGKVCIKEYNIFKYKRTINVE